MWRAYLNVVAKKLPEATHILDKFHIAQKISKAIDKVRASEAKRLKIMKTALYHQLGDLPELEFTHDFW